MLINQEKETCNTNLPENQFKKFGIEANQTALKIWMDTLYSNKEKSIIRELLSNAKDSQQVAGTLDIPIEVHLPEKDLEPWFSIRDFGTGLSEEDIYSTYSVFFKSTKNQTNDQIGGFGLGAKTPLSYTDQFEVASFYNGIKSTYLVFKDADGYPTITKLSSEETTEHNGLLVKFATARQNTFEVFLIHFLSTSKGFNIKVNKDLHIKEKKIFRTFESVNNQNFNVIIEDKDERATVLLGGISYPISSDYSIHRAFALDLDEKIDYENLEKEVGFELSSNLKKNFKTNCDVLNYYNSLKHILTFEFPVGYLEVTASRENLSLSKRTCENVKKAILLFIDLLYKDTLVPDSSDIANGKLSYKNEFIVKSIEQYREAESFFEIYRQANISIRLAFLKNSEICNLYSYSWYLRSCDFESALKKLLNIDINKEANASYSRLRWFQKGGLPIFKAMPFGMPSIQICKFEKRPNHILVDDGSQPLSHFGTPFNQNLLYIRVKAEKGKFEETYQKLKEKFDDGIVFTVEKLSKYQVLGNDEKLSAKDTLKYKNFSVIDFKNDQYFERLPDIDQLKESKTPIFYVPYSLNSNFVNYILHVIQNYKLLEDLHIKNVPSELTSIYRFSLQDTKLMKKFGLNIINLNFFKEMPQNNPDLLYLEKIMWRKYVWSCWSKFEYRKEYLDKLKFYTDRNFISYSLFNNKGTRNFYEYLTSKLSKINDVMLKFSSRLRQRSIQDYINTWTLSDALDILVEGKISLENLQTNVPKDWLLNKIKEVLDPKLLKTKFCFNFQEVNGLKRIER